MSDYARAGSGGATHFGDKDGYTTGDANKVIVGAQFDDEFNAILIAVATKYDSDNLASQAQAQGGTAPAVLMTPLRTEEWSATWAAENAGIVGDLQALADPAAHVLLGFDNTSNTAKAFANATNGGIALAAATIAIDINDLGIETGIAAGDFIAMEDITDNGSQKITFANFEAALALANLIGYDANEHIDHTAVSVIAGTGLTGGGTIAADRTLNVIGGAGITANANDVALTDVVAGAAQPVVITSGTFTFDLSSITEITMPNFSQSADKLVVSEAGTIKVMPYDEAGIKVATVAGTSDLLAATDMNTFIEYTAATAVTVTLNTGVGTVGNVILIKQTGAGQVTIAGSATVEAAVGLKTRTTDSVIALVCIAANTWSLYGDAAA
jgi:hypothetical protein